MMNERNEDMILWNSGYMGPLAEHLDGAFGIWAFDLWSCLRSKVSQQYLRITSRKVIMAVGVGIDCYWADSATLVGQHLGLEPTPSLLQSLS